MKSFPSALCFFLFVPAAWPLSLGAVEAVRIETVVYVFKDAAFARINLGADTRPAPEKGVVLRSPVTLTFDQQILALNGPSYAWNGDQPAPAEFSLLATPAIVAAHGQTATVRCSQAVQYLEKRDDGSLQVREIGRDSPDAPHYQFTLTATPTVRDDGFVLKCAVEVATLASREKIAGVELEAGRPVLARFKDEFRFPTAANAWSGIVLRRPSGSDYSLLMLLKVSSADAIAPPSPAAPATAKDASVKMVAGIAVSASGVTGLWIDEDVRGRIAQPINRWNQNVHFWLSLQGSGPVYREFKLRQHGAHNLKLAHVGAVTIDPKRAWVVIDLHEVVSKTGEPLRTEPCPANGRYPIAVVSNAAGGLSDLPDPTAPGTTRGPGPTPGEIALPIHPNEGYGQPR